MKNLLVTVIGFAYGVGLYKLGIPVTENPLAYVVFAIPLGVGIATISEWITPGGE